MVNSKSINIGESFAFDEVSSCDLLLKDDEALLTLRQNDGVDSELLSYSPSMSKKYLLSNYRIWYIVIDLYPLIMMILPAFSDFNG